jgi:branched-chain amino acid transport system ATP-binding protein
MLEVRALGARYGRIPALAGIDLRVGAGELVALVGANGAGKTTLLRTISGLQAASAGAIGFDGQEITTLSARRRVQLGIVQVPEGRQVFGPLSVHDNLRLGAFARGTREATDAVYALFPALRAKRQQAAGALSGGQQQMLAIGRALMAQPRLLLLDEPSMGLAPQMVQKIFETIRTIAAEGVTLLLVEQNAKLALETCDRGYVMESGLIALADRAASLLANPQVRQAYLGE